jgi:5'-deoxynucleotidase YfbR-like HD superfamily hydrolase
MNINEIIDRLLHDDSFVESELQKFVTYFNLKHTIRWARDREGDYTESVAEHVFGMQVLLNYFLPLIDSEKEFDINLVYHMATWHDMAEAVVSDMTTKTKTQAHEEAEKQAEAMLMATAPAHLKDLLTTLYGTYDVRASAEAKFVKAIDKMEPMFHLYFLKQKGISVPDHYQMQWEADEYREHRANYVDAFPILKRFDDLLHEEIKEYYPAK